MRVLVVEDEVRTAALLRRGLVEEGYAVDVAVDGPGAVWQAVEFGYDAVCWTCCCQARTASRCAGGCVLKTAGRRC